MCHKENDCVAIFDSFVNHVGDLYVKWCVSQITCTIFSLKIHHTLCTQFFLI